jgi:hypothetical protein
LNDFVEVRTWSFADICGNTSAVSQTIIVKMPDFNVSDNKEDYIVLASNVIEPIPPEVYD